MIAPGANRPASRSRNSDLMFESMKHRSCDSGLAAVPRPRAAASARTPALDCVGAEREDGALQLALIEAVKHVCLVAAGITGSMQCRQRAPPAGARIVAGRQVRRPSRSSALEQHAELDALVAPDARIRGDAALRIRLRSHAQLLPRNPARGSRRSAAAPARSRPAGRHPPRRSSSIRDRGRSPARPATSPG